MQAIKTARLVLRPLAAEHADAVMDMEADPRVMATAVISITPERRRAIIAYIDAMSGHTGHWAIEAGDTFIGWVSLVPLKNTDKIEVAYRLAFQHWGSGYATEAAAAGDNYR